MNKTIFAAAALFAAFSQAATLDGLAAKVDNDAITIGDVINEMRRIRPADDVSFGEAYSNAVEEAIDRRLILNAAVAKKLDMQEWLVDNRVREIVKDNFDGDMNKLTAALTQSKVSVTDWRNQIRDDMIVNAMRYQMVEKYVVATPAAMQDEYRLHRDRYCSEAGTTMSVILLRPPADDKTPSVDERGRDILKKLADGEDFAALARVHSADSHAKDGGLWKNVKPEESFRPEIVQVVSKLRPGEVSHLINLDGWGFIVRKEEETKARQLSFAEAYDKIAATIRREGCKERHAAWMKRLRAEAFIKIYPAPKE